MLKNVRRTGIPLITTTIDNVQTRQALHTNTILILIFTQNLNKNVYGQKN